jgi:hypothetical protein
MRSQTSKSINPAWPRESVSGAPKTTGCQTRTVCAMKKPQTTDSLRDLIARLQQQDLEMATSRKVLDIELRRIAQLQAEVDVLHGRKSPDAPDPHQVHAQPSPDQQPSQDSIAPLRSTGRQEGLFSAVRGRMDVAGLRALEGGSHRGQTGDRSRFGAVSAAATQAIE